MLSEEQINQIKYPSVTNIVAKELPPMNVRNNIVTGRWTAYGVLDDTRNIMISETFDNAQDAVDALIEFARKIKIEEFS